ncbi:hypothetical protein MIND_00776400 [Mycena indigotica]|uniref:Uncharacterized protein n=1 Tax=Mycena indigotica TaxID=2126181 RepID=A0A8H6SNY3_9AGAR|nr:uncharacterized protein MIND_00776400 [Mycena indigotica]KAF7302096.1 hypothetical protein MIND_00776400 [Mycena indigotica]
MPIPKLLKKLSRKSLRGHSSDSEADNDFPPALPPPEHDGDPRIAFIPPYADSSPNSVRSMSSGRSSTPEWNHPSRQRSLTMTNESSAPSRSNSSLLGAHSRQASQSSTTLGKVYSPPAGPPPPSRQRTISFGSSRSVPFIVPEPDELPASGRSPSRARVHSPRPSYLGAMSMTGSQLSASPTPQTPPDPPPAPSQRQVPDDEMSKDLAAAWQTANTAPTQSKFDKTLQVVEGNFIKAQAQESQTETFVTGVVAGLTAAGAMDAIESGIHSLVEGLPALFSALDEVAKVHPFIGVAVLAFKAVWSLEQKRRANDKLILSLHVEMRDMMAVLTQLKNVKDAEEIAPDGSSIRGRMQETVKMTAEDIKGCANACDTYTKKRTLVKVLKSGIWAGKLTAFVGAFTKRRGEFEFALSIHTALGVDAANRAISAVDKTTQEMNAKMDMMMKMFQQFMTPEQREMSRVVEQRGGIQACQDDDKLLKELNELENKSTSAGKGVKNAKGTSSAGPKFGLEDLKDELTTDPDAAIERNMTVFARKFEVQQRQIVDELTKVIEREGDRVISALSSGPHDRLLDPDVHHIWKDAGWRSSAKARHFVLALRDHYQEGGPGAAATQDHQPDKQNAGVDDWALQYISVSRLQSISEALDDDGSGWVTILEANTFTSSRPLDWSLTKWLALWAVGFHQSMQQYAIKVRELLAKMFAVRLHVLPENRVAVNKYLETIYHGVTTLHSGVNPCYINESLQEKFAPYFDGEEARLRGNLEAVKYDIDALNTLYLVTGQGRIERFLMPLLYLLLSRDFQILRACQNKAVHPDELWDSADTINWLELAARDRVTLLEETFKQQKDDPKQQFKTFSHGLFQHIHDPDGLWDPQFVLAQDEAEYPYDDNLEDQSVDLSKILNYPLGAQQVDFDAYKAPTKPKKGTTRPSAVLRTLLGTWNGFTYVGTSVVPTTGMISMDLTATGSLTFGAASRANMSDFTIAGECGNNQQNMDTIGFKFKQSFPTRYAPLYFSGSWTSDTNSLTGTWGEESDPRTHPGVFIFKRMSPDCLTFFPAPSELGIEPSRALWKFAIEAVRYAVSRQGWSWAFFEQRAARRKRFIELYIRDTQFGKPLAAVEQEELGMLRKGFTVADSRFFHSVAERQIRLTTDHDVSCDACQGHIGGTRVICLTCRLEGTFDTVDFCDTLSCTSVKVVPSGLTKAHLPNHDILKVKRVVHIRYFGRTFRDAQAALKRSREFFADPSDQEPRKRHKPAPNCRVCRRTVSQPCWFCVQCQEPSFICNACEARKHISFGNHNMDLHDLVRSQLPLPEEREADFQERFEQHEQYIERRLQQLETTVNDRLTKVDERLMEMERMLTLLVSTLGNNNNNAGQTIPTSLTFAPSPVAQKKTSQIDLYHSSYP